VNASASNGNGSSACPFTTITEALAAPSSVSSSLTINVAPGTYNAALGEVFPLQVGANVTIQGTGTTRDQTVIDGSGIYGNGGSTNSVLCTMVLQGSINLVKVTDSVNQPDAIIFHDRGSATVSTSDVVGGSRGIWSVPAALTFTNNPTLEISTQVEISAAQNYGVAIETNNATSTTVNISGLNVHGNDTGIYVRGGSLSAPTVVISSSQIHTNTYDGVQVQAANTALAPNPTVDLGSSTSDQCANGAARGGGNDLYCNGHYGVETANNLNVAARFNRWNNAQPTDGNAPADVSDHNFVNTSCSPGASTNACATPN
jgi:hypothetical protein